MELSKVSTPELSKINRTFAGEGGPFSPSSTKRRFPLAFSLSVGRPTGFPDVKGDGDEVDEERLTKVS